MHPLPQPPRLVSFGLVLVAAVAPVTACLVGPRSTARSPPPRLVTSVAPWWLEPPSPSPLACSVPARPTPTRVSLDLEEAAIAPARFGPRVHRREVASSPREADGLVAAVESHKEALNACYRWARRTTPALYAQLAVTARFDEWGLLSSLSVEADGPDGHDGPEVEPLRACVDEVLADLALPAFVARKTEARYRLAFHRTAWDAPRRCRARARDRGRPLAHRFLRGDPDRRRPHRGDRDRRRRRRSARSGGARAPP